MRHYKKNFKSFVTLFNIPYEGRSELLGSCQTIEQYHTEMTYDWGSWESNDWVYTTCPCGNGRLEIYCNYIEGCGSDRWISCSCKKCSQMLRDKFPEDVV